MAPVDLDSTPPFWQDIVLELTGDSGGMLFISERFENTPATLFARRR